MYKTIMGNVSFFFRYKKRDVIDVVFLTPFSRLWRKLNKPGFVVATHIYIRVEIRHYKTWWRNEQFSFYTYTWANVLVCLISSLFYCKLIIFMLSTTDLDPQKRFYHITFICAISCWFFWKCKFLINCTINIYQAKVKL